MRRFLFFVFVSGRGPCGVHKMCLRFERDRSPLVSWRRGRRAASSVLCLVCSCSYMCYYCTTGVGSGTVSLAVANVDAREHACIRVFCVSVTIIRCYVLVLVTPTYRAPYYFEHGGCAHAWRRSMSNDANYGVVLRY
jgi:hypothetical protein